MNNYFNSLTNEQAIAELKKMGIDFNHVVTQKEK